MEERRFLVACDGDYGRASMSYLPLDPQFENDVNHFKRRFAKYDLRIVGGEEMRRLMLATVGVKP